MRIAQIAPLAEAVPPKLYGGTERVVSWLTEELVRLGQVIRYVGSQDECERRAKILRPVNSRDAQDQALVRVCGMG